MNIVEKILARASGKREVSPGDVVNAKVDLAMVHDFAGPMTIEAFQRMGAEKLWDPDRIVVVLDHDAPPSSIKSAEMHVMLRKFVARQGIKNFHDVGSGICHKVMIEEYVKPGELIVGADSHSTTYGALGAFGTGIGSTDMAAVFATGRLWFKVPETIRINVYGKLKEFVTPKDLILDIIRAIGADGATYKAIEFGGLTIEKMSIDGRATLCNMTVEMGAKAGIVEPDERTWAYVGGKAAETIKSDPDAHYQTVMDIDVSNLEPQIACPSSVDNVKPISEVEGIEIDQAFIGSCTNGHLDDLRLAARVLKGRAVSKDVRLIIVPSSKRVYMEALRRGYIEIFLKAGASVCSPSCGPCLGISKGVLSAGEVCISSSNRNFVGRMGSPKAKIYLASPATVAASAITGKITDPRLV